MALETPRDVWYLAGPFFRYEQDVKALARRAGVRIVDATVTESREHAAENVPTVTLKPEYRPAAPALSPELQAAADAAAALAAATPAAPAAPAVKK